MSNSSKLNDIIAKILLMEENEISDSLSREDVEDWDSMTHLVLVSEIEKEFDVRFDDDAVAEIETIKDLKSNLNNLGVELN